MDVDDLFHAIEAVRAEQAQQHEARLAVLIEIRDDQRALLQALQEPLPETATATAPCTHPPECRTDDTFGARFWKCKRCGFVYDNERASTT